MSLACADYHYKKVVSCSVLTEPRMRHEFAQVDFLSEQ
jgi:hypothetical protein